MNPFMDVITRILGEFGLDAFDNAPRAHAMLADLALGMKKERILARALIEIGGPRVLKNAHNPTLAANTLVQGLVDEHSIRLREAQWIVHSFAIAMGLDLPEHTMDAAVPEKPHGFPLPVVSLGRAHAAAVCCDGSVISGGRNTNFECDTSSWENMASVSCGTAHTLGLSHDGVVFACGSNSHNQCAVAGMTDVARVFAISHTSVCVKANGSVYAVGRSEFDLSGFSDIADVAFYPSGLIGLRHDGSLCVYAPDAPVAEVEWLMMQKNVTRLVATYTSGVVVLTRDGRLLKSNKPDTFFAQFHGIRDIVSMSDCFAALGNDGRVRVIGFEQDSPKVDTKADDWIDVLEIHGG